MARLRLLSPLCLACALGALALPAGAQAPAAPVAAVAPVAHTQNLIDLYEAARRYDASYQAARAQYDASLARAQQAKAGLLPTVGLSASASTTQQQLSTTTTTAQGQSIPVSIHRDVPQQSAGINAVQPIYRPANWAVYEQGKRQAEIARAQLASADQDLILRVSQAYFDVLASQDSLALVRTQKAAVAEQLAFAKRNFEVGTATITDTREAQARYDLVLAQEIAAENDVQVKQLALDQLVGQANSTPTPLAAPVVLPTLLPADMAAWVAQTETAHPLIAQARYGLEVAQLEVDKARAGHLPTLDAQLGYNVTNNPQGTSTSTSSGRVRVNAASIGLALNVPLFAGFAVENRVKETLALEEQASATLEATRRNVAQATRAAYLGLVAGASQVKALEAAEASSQSALEANRLGYQVGVRINIDVLNAQSQLFQTRRDLAQARYNVLLGHLRLRQANGTLEAGNLQAVNAMLAPPGAKSDQGGGADAGLPPSAVSPVSPAPVAPAKPATPLKPPVR